MRTPPAPFVGAIHFCGPAVQVLRRVYNVLHAVYGYRAGGHGQESFDAQNALAVGVQERGEPHSEGCTVQRLAKVNESVRMPPRSAPWLACGSPLSSLGGLRRRAVREGRRGTFLENARGLRGNAERTFAEGFILPRLLLSSSTAGSSVRSPLVTKMVSEAAT